MKMTSSKPLDKGQKHPKVLIDKQEAVGCSDVGTVFDSGCNLSGIRKVHMLYGNYCRRVGRGSQDVYVIRKIFLEFEKPMNSIGLSPTYNGEPFAAQYFRTFDVFEDDAIVKVDVWTTEKYVTGIRFHLKSGSVSELFGEPLDPSQPPSSFEGKHPGSKLVGIHGLYSKGISNGYCGYRDTYKVGFTFATVVPEDASWSSSLEIVESPSRQSSEEEAEEHVVVTSWTELSKDEAGSNSD